MPTSTNVTNLKINELKEAQYDTAVQQGVIGANELSILTDVDVGGLPDQTGNAGKFLTTDGTDASWGDTFGITLKSSATTPLTVVRNTYNHSISFSGSYATPTIDLFSGTAANRPTINLPKVSAVEVASSLFKKQSNDGGFSLPRGSGYIAVQVDTMPTAGSVFLGNVVQFIGTTDSTYTHGHLYECVSDGQDPATYSWTEVQLGGGSSYTAGTGIDITGGVISVTSPTLQNTAQSGKSAVAIGGASSQSTSGFYSVLIDSLNGSHQSAGTSSIAILGNSTGRNAINIGGATSSGTQSIAIGDGANATANGAMQICLNIGSSATNSDANTVKFANANGNFEIMSADGTIPAARHASLPATDGTYVLKLVIASGVPTLSWVAE